MHESCATPPKGGCTPALNNAPLKLKVGDVAVSLHREYPGVVEYRAAQDRAPLLGSASAEGFDIVLFDPAGGDYLSRDDPRVALDVQMHSGDISAFYRVAVTIDGRRAASVAVSVLAEREGLRLRSDILQESEELQVASVRMKILRVARDAPGAALAFANRCGRLVRLATAKPERADHFVDWFEPIPVAIVCNDDLAALLTLDTADCQFSHEVTESDGSVTVDLLHRHRVQKAENSFLAQRTASCQIRFATAAKDRKVDWTAGAAMARDGVPVNLSDLYIGKLVYKVMLQVRGSEAVTTYPDVLSLIKRVRRLTGSVQQIVYLIGWQHDGHDTGYPDVYTPNPRVGTFDDFKALKQAAKAENAIVSLHDNFHDAYMDSPLWDPKIVCVNPDGELRKGGIWAGGQAYEIGPVKYLPQAVERARRTVAMLELEKTTHLDVLSDKPNMVDFDPAAPANREQNAQAKQAIVEAFRSCGVDVTSEVLTAPFLPFMHHFWHAERRPAEEWSPDERIPLVPFITHGKVTAGGDASTDEAKLEQIAYGLTFSTDWNKDTSDEEIMDLYFLVAVPWGVLARREITGFERGEGWDKILYGANSFVRVNRGASRYEVVADGVQVAEDFATFAPRAPGEWVVYARRPRTVRLPLRAAIEIVPLLGGRAPAWTPTDAGVEFPVEPRTPYVVRLS